MFNECVVRTIALLTRPAPHRPASIIRAEPRLVALAHTTIDANDLAWLGIPPVSDIIRHAVWQDLHAIITPPSPSDITSTQDGTVVNALLAAAWHGSPIPPDIQHRVRQMKACHRMRLAIAGIAPIPEHPTSVEAGWLLCAGWFDERLVDIAASDPIPLAQAAAAYPHILTPERWRAIISRPDAAEILAQWQPSLRGIDELITSVARSPWSSGRLLINAPHLCDQELLIGAASREPEVASNVIVHCPLLRDHPWLVESVARNAYEAANVLIHCPAQRTNARLITAAAGKVAAATALLAAAPELEREPELIRAIAENCYEARDLLMKCPTITHPDLIRAVSRWPAHAADVVIARPDLRTNKELVKAAAQTPHTAARLLSACADLRSQPEIWAPLAFYPSFLVDVLRKAPDQAANPLVMALVRGELDSLISPETTSLMTDAPPSPSERLAALLDAAGPHPAWWRHMTFTERSQWATSRGVSPAILRWLDRKANGHPVARWFRASAPPHAWTWTDRDIAFIQSHPVLRPLATWAVPS